MNEFDFLINKLGGESQAETDRIEKTRYLMIVDDDEYVRRSLATVFSEYTITLAASGTQALNEVSNKVSCIIMDAKMPPPDGFVTSCKILDRFPQIPIIMHTAFHGEHNTATVVDHHFFAYIEKGAPVKILKHKVAKAFQYFQLIKENEEYKCNLEKKVEEKTQELKNAQAREQYLDQQLRIKNLLQSSEDIGAQILHDYKNLTQPLGNTLSRTERFINLIKPLMQDIKNLIPENEFTRLQKLLNNLEESVGNGLTAFHEIIAGYEHFRQAYNPREDGMNDLNRDLEAAINLVIDRNFRSFIEVEKDFSTVTVPVTYDSRQFNKGVFMNLLKNAREAIVEKGGDGKILVRTSQSGEQIKVEIADTGIGIPQDMDIFAKKVTSKQSGTGLGLYTARFIVEEAGGNIRHTKAKQPYTTRFEIEL